MELDQIVKSKSDPEWHSASVWVKIDGCTYIYEVSDGRITDTDTMEPGAPELDRDTEKQARELARTTYQTIRGVARAYSHV